MPLFLLFIVIPVIEIAVLIKVGSWIGLGWTLLIILATAIIGVRVLKQQGTDLLMRAGQRLNEGSLPARELAEGFLLALAGAFLLTPGFVTDAFGFALLMPPVRLALVSNVVKLLAPRMVVGGGSPFGQRPEGFGRQGADGFDGDDFPRPGRPQAGNRHRPETLDGEFRRED